MNRVIIPVMGALLGAMITTNAAAVTGNWCFKWGVDYDDSDMGEDYVVSDRPARYTYVTVQETDHEIIPYFLDSGGCTADVTILPNTTYFFRQYTRAQRSSRDVYVLSTDAVWSSTSTPYASWQFTTASSLPSPYTKTFDHPSTATDQIRIMPAVGNMLYFANTLAWDNSNDLKISFDHNCDSLEDITTSCHYRPSGSSTSQISLTHPDYKFFAAHEMGHMIAVINGGPGHGSNTGDRGGFRDSGDTDHNCDSSAMGSDGHDLTTREFTGNAHMEGWADFIAAAAYNDISEVSGRFVNMAHMMKWSNSHAGDLCWSGGAPCLPGWDTYSNSSTGLEYWDAPHVLPLDSGSAATDFVEWVDFECDPTGDGFTHYGTSWDWIEFFWNLLVDASHPYTVAEMADVWVGISNNDYAYFCCNSGTNPTACVYDLDGVCSGPTYTALHTVGKLWTSTADDADDFGVSEGALESVWAIWGGSNPDKAQLFEDAGGFARLDF
jgi:hypothetical protein